MQLSGPFGRLLDSHIGIDFEEHIVQILKFRMKNSYFSSFYLSNKIFKSLESMKLSGYF